MANKAYTPIIGLEIHTELRTVSKMFCGCKNDPFHAPKPNLYTCPVCLGLPGALPVPNSKAIDWTIFLGLALHCQINKNSKFDRKHYFYPDLPKGYQISQYDQPLAVNGWIEIKNQSANQQPEVKRIRIRRVHLEEDTGKLLHQSLEGNQVSLVDFNRSGVPLVEIVTEPDIRSAGEAKLVAQEIHSLIRALEISDADMEKGSMRLEANTSLLHDQGSKFKDQIVEETELPTYKVEIKNINSFRFLERAIDSEIERQREIIDSGEKVPQQTRGWDSTTQTTKSQRTKEEAADYRYFPDPDIPPLVISDQKIDDLNRKLPKTPDFIEKELTRRGVQPNIANVVAYDRSLSAIYQKLSSQNDETIREFLKWLQHHKSDIKGQDTEDLLSLYKSSLVAVISDESQLTSWVAEVISENPKVIAQFNSGETKVLGFLIGQVQKKAKGKANAPLVYKLLVEKIK